MASRNIPVGVSLSVRIATDPFYKDRPVAVVGGGNSGVEAAIDLAGICSHVTVLEFMDSLKADVVLQDKLRSLPNVEVFTSVQTTSVEGDGSKVTAVRFKDRASGEERTIPLDGVFVQIGLSANSDLFDGLLERNRAGEIVIDDYCRTGIPGVYAAAMSRRFPTSRSSWRWEREQKPLCRLSTTGFAA